MDNNLIINGEAKEVTEIRHRILTEFSDLEFQEEGHIYTLHGEHLPSVSHVTHQFNAYPFNEQEQAIAYAEKEIFVHLQKFNY